MNNIYWIGIKESDLDDAKHIFKKSVTYFGKNSDKNISYSSQTGERVNHNLVNNKANKFIAHAIQEILCSDSEAHFMYFSPYHAYFLPKEILQKVYCINHKSVLEMLRNKINTRFWLAYIVPIVPSILIDSSRCNYKDISQLFDNKFDRYVVQQNYSAGGYSTYVLSKTQSCKLEKNELLLASPYYEKSVSINITAIIYKNDVVLYPASIQIIVEDKCRLLYKGADFISYKTVDKEIQNKVVVYAKKICKYLQNIGYCGICGIDFLSDGKEVYFMEVNERFQASTYLLNLALKEHQLPSVQEMCIQSFDSEKCDFDLSELCVNYSNYIYTYHESYKHCYPYIYRKAKKNNNVLRIVGDDYLNCNIYEEDAYLFALIFKINITTINFDGCINIDEHIQEHISLSEKDVLKTKISLLNQGFTFTEDAKKYIDNNGNIRKAINDGVDLILFDSIRVNSVFNNHRLLNLTPFEINYNSNDGLILTHYGNKLSVVSYDLPDFQSKYETIKNSPYSDIAFLANGRLQINHENVCFYKRNNISCQFCGLPTIENSFSIDNTFEVIDSYLINANINSFLIGGASNNYCDGWENIFTIANYISTHSDKPIYLMSPPPPNKEILYQLKQAGITEISFNIEIFDREIASKIMPGKGKIPLELYYTMLKEGTRLWGKSGQVRSMIMVGLEKEQSLMEGIEYLAQNGIQPILSPFGPRQTTPLANYIPFNSEKLLDIFLKADLICRKYGLKPGPNNIECQNNTLSIPDRYMHVT